MNETSSERSVREKIAESGPISHDIAHQLIGLMSLIVDDRISAEDLHDFVDAYRDPVRDSIRNKALVHRIQLSDDQDTMDLEDGKRVSDES